MGVHPNVGSAFQLMYRVIAFSNTASDLINDKGNQLVGLPFYPANGVMENNCATLQANGTQYQRHP